MPKRKRSSPTQWTAPEVDKRHEVMPATVADYLAQQHRQTRPAIVDEILSKYRMNRGWRTSAPTPWTERERTRLRELAGTTSPDQIAQELGRPEQAVREAARWYGVALKFG